MALKTNYKNTVIDSTTNPRQKFNMITNSDGTTSFEDVTTYSQIGDAFDAGDINDTNKQVNALEEKLDSIELTAKRVTYDDTSTSLDATTVQDAVESLSSKTNTLSDALANKITKGTTDLTAGTSTLANGNIYVYYVE